MSFFSSSYVIWKCCVCVCLCVCIIKKKALEKRIYERKSFRNLQIVTRLFLVVYSSINARYDDETETVGLLPLRVVEVNDWEQPPSRSSTRRLRRFFFYFYFFFGRHEQQLDERFENEDDWDDDDDA